MRRLMLVLMLSAAVASAQRGGFGGGFRGHGGGFRGPAGSFRGPVVRGPVHPGGFYRGPLVRSPYIGHQPLLPVFPSNYYAGYRGRVGFGFGGFYGGFSSWSSPWVIGGNYVPAVGYGPILASPYAGTPLVYSAPDPYGYSQGPNITIITAPSSNDQPAPVIINDSPRRWGWREEAAPPAPAAPRAETRTYKGSPIYLFATRQGTIWAGLGYWVEGRTIHFLTRNNERKQLQVDELDRVMTEQLNSERGIQIDLP